MGKEVWIRAAAIWILIIVFIGFISYAADVQRQKIAQLLGKTVTATKTKNVELILNRVYGVALQLTVIILPAIAVVAVVRSLSARGRLLGVVKFDDLQRHVLLFGPTGSGKTSTALRAIELSLEKGVPVEVLDWKGEYMKKVRGATVLRKLKLLEPPDWSLVENHAIVVTDILRDVLELTEPMSFMLYEELLQMYESGKATFTALLEQLKRRRAVALANRHGVEVNIAEGLIRRLLPLALDERRSAENLYGDDRVVVYDLSELPSYQLKTLYAEILLWRLYNEAKADGAVGYGLRKLIICEEAQNYVRPRRADQPPSIGERVVNELRAYGYGFILIAPDPNQLPYHMARDCGAVISIGYQGLPQVVAELLNFYRYADIKKLIKTTSRPRTYIYHEGRLHIKGLPKPYLKVIDLGAEAKPLIEEEVVEEAVEEEPEPIGGATHPRGRFKVLGMRGGGRGRR